MEDVIKADFLSKNPALRVAGRVWIKGFKAAISLSRPFWDFLARFVLAQALLASAFVKLSDWQTAIALATFEYPVPFMSPVMAAQTGLAIELIGGILLLLGLMTRGASLAVAILLVVSQFYYIPTDYNLFAIALLSWFFVHGAGAFSTDRVIGKGVADSALPLAAQLYAFGQMMTVYLSPWLLFIFRLWLAITMLISAEILPGFANAMLYPSGSFAPILPAILIGFAAFAFLGIAGSVFAVTLALLLTGTDFMGFNPSLTFASILMVLVFLFHGSGQISFDRVIGHWLERNLLFDRKHNVVPDSWPHVVIIGGGFGGLSCAMKLKDMPVRITLIDRNNFHLFQPLLYQVATAGLSPSDVAIPIRSLFRNDRNVRILLGEVSAIDRDAQTVTYNGGSTSYDHLVVATGATHSYFGKDEWAPFAPGLKRVEDAINVRGQVLRAFEEAEASNDPEQVKRLLTFVIVGGGPTGVELAGAIAELARFGLADEYRNFDPGNARVILVQSGPRVLLPFPESLSENAAQSLRDLGVELLLGGRVTDIQDGYVQVGEDRIDTETVLWAAGVAASPAGKWLSVETDRAGRVPTDEYCRLQDSPNIYVIGDTASTNAWDGNAVPGLAPAAKQAGLYVASALRQQLSGQGLPPAYRYKHQGNLATIGRKAAVADFGKVKFSGTLAWWFWGIVHVGFLVGVRNRATVLINWIWNYFTLRMGIRLITNDERK